MSDDEDYVIYLLVRKDLKMGKGKMAAQCGHAVQDLIEKCPPPLKQKYMISGCTKIVLQINKEVDLLEKWEAAKDLTRQTTLVIDAGKTQLLPNTTTVLGIGPIKRAAVQKIVSDLSLF